MMCLFSSYSVPLSLGLISRASPSSGLRVRVLTDNIGPKILPRVIITYGACARGGGRRPCFDRT